jgi:hypothetical protein
VRARTADDEDGEYRHGDRRSENRGDDESAARCRAAGEIREGQLV